MAAARRAFFFVTDDPVRLRLELYTQEQPPESLDTHFEPLGGTFGLDIPSGELAVAGWNNEGNVKPTRLSVGARGAHVLRVLCRRPFDAQRHDEEMIAQVGETDYRFFDKVNKSGVVGCVPLVLTAICLLARQWEWLWYLVPPLGRLMDAVRGPEAHRALQSGGARGVGAGGCAAALRIDTCCDRTDEAPRRLSAHMRQPTNKAIERTALRLREKIRQLVGAFSLRRRHHRAAAHRCCSADAREPVCKGR